MSNIDPMTEESEISPLAELQAGDVDLKTILAAWTTATDRLEKTHQALQAEVHRLTDELEAKNRELARRNRLADLGQMASHVAHEVRNSLVPMKLYLSLLRRQTAGAGSSETIDQMTSGLIALETTVTDLLHFSAERDPKRTKFAVPQLLHEICDSLLPQLAAQGIRTQIDAPAELKLHADRDMFRRAVLNLVLNALDAMPRGGFLLITACQGRFGLEIEVADSGPGIEEESLEHLFEPFFTTKASGTGLGLAIVERIAEAHGGQILAANCPEGGAAFTICIPGDASAADTYPHCTPTARAA
jgi:signal transduction histidine kinase